MFRVWGGEDAGWLRSRQDRWGRDAAFGTGGAAQVRQVRHEGSSVDDPPARLVSAMVGKETFSCAMSTINNTVRSYEPVTDDARH